MIGKRHKNHDAARVLDVDASMQGSLVFKDPVSLRINGRFEGTLNTRGDLTIGEHAVVNADITGETIVIAGKVNGNIHALKELKIIKPAQITGDIRTPRLTIADGAIFDGNCRMRPKAGQDHHPSSGLMTPEDVAKYLEVDSAMILEWVSSGKLPGFKDGDVWKFDRAKIDEWVAAGKIR
ncbi:MAG: polymer-forming cytoskeletal protein [Candidatus Omnitrophica bacterium]|nr:polymer-forming cytoskeletal protein [Candidatus Omnitrophota bacterium]